jgi:uncharacterized protein
MRDAAGVAGRAEMRIASSAPASPARQRAWLCRAHEVVLFEAEAAAGRPHPHPRHRARGRSYSVDTGFIVFNPDRYPLLSRLFAELGVESQPTTMSFSVQNAGTGLEYNAQPRSLFCQRRNLLSAALLGHGARHPALLPRGAGAAADQAPGPAGRLPRRQPLRPDVHR